MDDKLALDALESGLVSQRLRQMWKGQVIGMVSAALLVVVAVISLMSALTNPVAMYVRGGFGVALIFTLAAAAAVLVGAVITLVGLYGLRDVQPEYRTAFLLQIIGVILNAVSKALGEGSRLAALLSLAGSVLALAALWMILKATGRMLSAAGREDVVARGRDVWGVSLLNIGVGAMANGVMIWVVRRSPFLLPSQGEQTLLSALRLSAHGLVNPGAGALVEGTAALPVLQSPLTLVPLMAALVLVQLAAAVLYIGYLGRAADALASAGPEAL